MNDQWELPSHLSPTYKKRAANFQRIFGVHFPYLAEDFHQSCIEMEWLWFSVKNNPQRTVRWTEDRADVQKTAKFLRALAKREVPWCGAAIDVRHQLKADKDNKVLQYEEELMDFLLTLKQMDEEGLTDSVLEKFTLDAESEIDRYPHRGNINWKAFDAVERLRGLWWRNTDKEAPQRALNPASKFAAFLRDGLLFLQIDADPVSAFKRWAEIQKDWSPPTGIFSTIGPKK